jgi:hypothetical protein
LRQEGAFPAAYFAKRWQERNDLAQTYLNNLRRKKKVNLVEKQIESGKVVKTKAEKR